MQREEQPARSGTAFRPFSDVRREVLRRFEVDYVWRVLIAAKGNISEAARLAKIDRKHLWRLIQRSGIRVERK